eukprot:s3646_g5.t1
MASELPAMPMASSLQAQQKMEVEETWKMRQNEIEGYRFQGLERYARAMIRDELAKKEQEELGKKDENEDDGGDKTADQDDNKTVVADDNKTVVADSDTEASISPAPTLLPETEDSNAKQAQKWRVQRQKKTRKEKIRRQAKRAKARAAQAS